MWTQPISSGSSALYGTPSGLVPLTLECIRLTLSMRSVAAAVPEASIESSIAREVERAAGGGPGGAGADSD